MKQYNVLIVDDSAVVRRNLSEILSKDPNVKSVTTATDPIFAKQKMISLWPDVIILDVEMPRMDGITFLKEIMNERPTPVIICSSLTEQGAALTMEAVASGAVDIITKPKINVGGFLGESAELFLRAVQAASLSNVAKLARHIESKPVAPIRKEQGPALTGTTYKLIVIGTSTGGTNALEQILTELPPAVAPIAIVQHMPEKFTAQFAQRLNSLSQIEVIEASHGIEIFPGRAVIAPGNHHMQVRMSGARFYVEIKDGPAVNHHRPSVDVLFRSVAKQVGANAVGFIMTGMGDDGARGLLEMREAGAITFAQDEESSVVWGMPKEAIQMGAANRVIPLSSIASEIIKLGSI